jgi:hypothetical protein
MPLFFLVKKKKEKIKFINNRYEYNNININI